MAPKRILALQSAESPLDLAAPLAGSGWEVKLVHDVAAAVATVRRFDGYRVGLVVLDQVSPGSATELRAIAAVDGVEWIAIVPKAGLDVPEIAQALVENFYDFHTLPLDLERLLVVVGHALGRAALVQRLPEREAAATGRYGMVGRSAPMLELYRAIDKVVRVDAPVLISGESGTGKELVARAIHDHSPRRRGPFVPVNCGVLPVNLVQSELFGHEKGAFTGAHQRRKGSLECAEGGIVFLDEIGDLPLESQASLLRFLQEKKLVRVGSSVPIGVDTRVIAATHVDLAAAVRRRREFREDLYYRLNVLHLQMPPLRERDGDISLHAEAVFSKFASQKGPAVKGFSRAALAAMEAHNWPGNVRELINRVQKAMIMCDGRRITAADLGLAARNGEAASISLERARHHTERDLIAAALERNRHNVAATARQLGISRVTLYRLMQKLEISRATQAGIAPPRREQS
jgi:DNA-binding NtrC family response regulator